MMEQKFCQFISAIPTAYINITLLFNDFKIDRLINMFLFFFFVFFQSNYSSVPRDKNVFKLRTNIEKQICFTIQQVLSADQPEFDIERCFGVLISPGCNVKHSDMQLLDTVILFTYTVCMCLCDEFISASRLVQN